MSSGGSATGGAGGDRDFALVQMILNRRQSLASVSSLSAQGVNVPASPSRSLILCDNSVGESPILQRGVSSASAGAYGESSLGLASPTSNRRVADFGTKQDDVSFPAKLFALLSKQELNHVVSWMPHGRSWTIRDLEAFVTIVLPLHFDLGVFPENFKMFVKILKAWGFHQFTSGPDLSAYYHPTFLRGQPQLLRLMSSIGPNASLHNTERQPDLYTLPHAEGQSVTPKGSRRASIDQVVRSRSPEVQALRNAVYAHPPSFKPEPRASLGGREYALGMPNCQQATNMSDFNTGLSDRGSLKEAMHYRIAQDSSLHHDSRDDTFQHLLSAGRVASLDQSSARESRRAAISSLCSVPITPNTPAEPGTKVQSPPITKDEGPPVKKKPRRRWLPPLDAEPLTPSPKKPRRKWLPPLGPRNDTRLAAAHSVSPQYNQITQIDQYDWIYTNPELFATLVSSEAVASAPKMPMELP